MVRSLTRRARKRCTGDLSTQPEQPFARILASKTKTVFGEQTMKSGKWQRNAISAAVSAALCTGVVVPAFAQSQAGENVEEVIVTGLRGSLQQSMETKREAVGVVDAISAEDI